jgi:hypothetical protein
MSPRALWDALGDRLRALSTRDRRALLLGVVVLGPALAWALVVRPYRSTLQNLQDRLASESALLEREKAVLAEAGTYPARLEAARTALSQWDARFVRSANPALAEAETTAVLEEVARENRVLLQEVRTMPLPPGSSAPEGLVPIRLSVRGESDFEGVLRFLNGMEQHPLLLRVAGLSVEPVPPSTAGGGRGGGPATQPGAMTFVVIVEAFIPPDSAAVGG